MTPLDKLRRRLRCPIHHGTLLWPADDSLAWPLRCVQYCVFPIRNGILRFVPDGGYATAFGTQWAYYAQTQLDSFTGHPISRTRLEQALGAPIEMLKGQTVLEVGSGAGRFTEILLQADCVLASMDLSNAVEANWANCGHRTSYLLVQADINQSPFPEQAFDVVLCLGVVQHTPAPEQTIAHLAQHVRPGGQLVFDHYSPRSRGWNPVASGLRASLRRVARHRPAMAMRLTRALTQITDPIRRRTVRHRALDRVAGRLFPGACYYANFPELPPETIYAWNELDTHDMFTDWFKHFRTRDQIEAVLAGLGLDAVECFEAGSTVIARARVPA